MAFRRSISISLVLAFLCFLSITYVQSYRKELRTRNEVNKQTVTQLVTTTRPDRLDPSRVTQVSWRPRVFLYRGFLTDEECDHLISLAKTKLDKPVENAHDTGKSETSDVDQDDIVASIEDRISAWTFLPKENSNHLKILHYGPEDMTSMPHDRYVDKVDMETGVMATVVLFLSNVTRGGEILFPDSKLESSQQKDETWSDCSKTSLAIRPMKGNALLFFNMQLNASRDNTSSHSRCPVDEGENWSAAKFFYVRAINENNGSSESDNSDCADEDDNCVTWAAMGECEKNPIYMIGTPDYYGSCRKSCKVC